MSENESIIIDDLIVLGRAVPSELRDRRRTICTAGFSPTLGFIRIYPTSYDSPLKRWNIVRVEVERAISPRFNGRSESWKIVGARDEWRYIRDKIEVIDELPRERWPELLSSLVDDCVCDIEDADRSLGIIKPRVILDTYFEDNKDYVGRQMMLDGRFRIMTKKEFKYEPRIRYECTNCRIGRGYHDQQLLEWGVYEWVRKYPDNMNQVWDNLGLTNPDYEKYFFVGNQLQYQNSFMVISVLRFKKS